MDYPGKVITKNQVTPTQISATGVWTLDDAAAAVKNNNWPVAGVPNPISKSLRFNSADTAYLSRTLSSSGNRKTWTWSGWIKGMGSGDVIFGAAGSGGGQGALYFTSSSLTLREYAVETGSETFSVISTAKYRDPSAWYHIVAVFDTTQATASNRIKLYVNGVQITSFSTSSYPSLNFDAYNINNSSKRALIGTENYSASTTMNGYQTEINFIDGQALTPSSFGMSDPVTGVWEPLKYSGTYGTNGFYLNFKDATSTTTLGYDYSGNANNWTTNNFSVTAGAGNDSMTDVPTPWVAYNTTGDVGGVVRGNYCTMNPVAAVGGVTLTNGNLRASVAQKAVPRYISVSTIAFTGIVYAEVTITPGGGPNPSPSIGIKNSTYKSFEGSATTAGQFAYGFRDSSTPNILKDENGSSSTFVAGGSMSSGDIMMLAVDVAAGKMWLGKNGSWLQSGNPAAGTNPAISGFSTTVPYWFFCATDQGTTTDNVFEWNFGQRPFAYTPPSGFLSLCTTNLPASTVLKGSEYMNAVLYTGTGSSQNITGLEFQPDWVWIKSRSAAGSHSLYDVIRGVRNGLFTNVTSAENTEAAGYSMTAFNSNGFTVGLENAGSGSVNVNGTTYVAWNWKANGTGVTNTAGSITSTVSANTTSGFSIVTYTGTGSAATFGHGLGVTPAMYIVKIRNGANNWVVWHNKLANTTTSYILLDSTAAETTSANIWGSTAATSTTIGVGTAAATNANASTYVAYCFAAISGFSAFGSYTGNGSADGPFVYTGFRPRFVLVKESSGAGNNWVIYDTARDTFNECSKILYPNASNAEFDGSTVNLDILSNGFKPRDNWGGNNNSGSTYIYAAFAENPFKNALAR